MSKIKSIKIEKQYIPLTLLNEIWLQKIEQKKPPESVTIYSDGVKVEVEYESEPKILKRPDKSIISGFESNNKDIQLICININGFKICEYSLSDLQDCCEMAFKLGLIYLLEDKHLAEKKARMLTKQLEITNEIERLNAEQGWVADLGNDDQEKCSFCYSNSYKRIDISYYCQGQSGVLVSSEEILTEIKDEYSEDELKQFLGIII